MPLGSSPSRLLMLVAFALGGCSSPPAEVTSESESTTGGATTGARSTTTAGSASTGPSSVDTGVATGGGSSSGVVDSSGSTSSEGTADTGPATSGSSSGGVSELGCADGVRDALTDTQTYPDIAACAGGFWVPGLHLDLPTCDRNGGNDGPLADGMGCSIDDLCAAGWHVCASQSEVEAAGVVDCDALPWGQQFFATAQSGNGKDSCAATGTNDVFGCGDVGYSEIFSCAPLNRSAGNNCVNLPGAWECDGHPFDELQHITKTGSDFGGALCCRDGA